MDAVAKPLGAPEAIGLPPQTPPNPNPTKEAAGGGTTDKERMVPYERLEAVARQNQEMRNQLREMSERLEVFEKSGKELEDLQAKKREEQEFWKNPYEASRKTREELKNEIRQMAGAFQEQAEFDRSLAELRASPVYSQDLEQGMVKYIQSHKLDRIDRPTAIRASFEAVTGKPWAELHTQGRTNSVRSVKERLMRPAAGGGSGPVGMSEEDFNDIPIEKYGESEESIQKFNAALQAFMRAQG